VVDFSYLCGIVHAEGEGAVDELTQVLKALDGEGDRSTRVTSVLRWLTRALHVGAAVLIDLGNRTEKATILATSGTLSGLKDGGSLQLDGSAPLAAGSSVTFRFDGGSVSDTAYFQPVCIEDGTPVKGILLHGEGAAASPADHQAEILLGTTLLRLLLENDRLKEQFEREKDFISLLVDKKINAGGPVNPGFDLITEGLELPLYMSTSAGALMYASPAFLRLVGYPSVNDIRRRTDFFLEPQSRAAELNLLRANGKVSSYSLGVRAGSGQRLEIQDSAVTVGAFVFGVFFDVTGFLAANKELKDSLEIQELLNDRIIAASQMLQRTQVTSIRALARLAEYRDQETGFHLQRICEYTRIIAQQVYENKPYSFHLTVTYPSDISISSMLHDIGKVSIPDSILLKPGKLDGGEWEIMKTHTTAGWGILHRADKELGEQSFLTLASTIALSHHEKYDGTGYPSGLEGEKIPLSARISALADVYDALTTKRPYKEAWSHEKAVEEIVSCSGSQFDPVLVDIFSASSDEFDGIRRVFPE
jgi:HD-GYP domain-containing protein (c-di-GMP phosphodiesterase class II)